jgi:hypothetical protein
MPGPDLVNALDDHLEGLRAAAEDPSSYPRNASAYLADWSRPDSGWLRRHYPAGRDIPEYEPTPAVESALAFVQSLGPREFVGTASRLLTVRDLLRQIAAGAAVDPAARLDALMRQRAEIDDRIAALEAGTDAGLDDTAVRERYAQVVDTARALLRDMRAVEAGMRDLDRRVRAQATTWDGPRGELLAAVFGTQASIAQSDEGRSWQAFWEHLLSRSATAELNSLLEELSAIEAIGDRASQAQVLLRTDLFHAAEATQRALASVSAQLRRFLDDQHWAEARRVDALIRDVLAVGLAAVGQDPSFGQAELDDVRIPITLPIDRPLYLPRATSELDPHAPEVGRADDADLADLFEAFGIDVAALSTRIDEVVSAHGGATLGQVIAEHPLDSGLAELLGYLQALPDSADRDLARHERVPWTNDEGVTRIATIPVIRVGAVEGVDEGTDDGGAGEASEVTPWA